MSFGKGLGARRRGSGKKLEVRGFKVHPDGARSEKMWLGKELGARERILSTLGRS